MKTLLDLVSLKRIFASGSHPGVKIGIMRRESGDWVFIQASFHKIDASYAFVPFLCESKVNMCSPNVLKDFILLNVFKRHVSCDQFYTNDTNAPDVSFVVVVPSKDLWSQIIGAPCNFC